MTARRPLAALRAMLWGLAVTLCLLALVQMAGAQTVPVPADQGEGLPKVRPDPTQATPGTKPTKSISITPAAQAGPDYAAWDRLATRAETAIADGRTLNQGLELLRSQLVDWRAALLLAQNTNSTRIGTLRTQIQALGAAPASGETEADEIALRRKALTDQLVRLQAPGIAAEEAYTRADGLIREIDRTLRERQANELLKLWPVPINPANWPLALKGITTTTLDLWEETRGVATGARAGRDLRDNLPLILALLGLAVALIWRGRGWIDAITQRLADLGPERARKLWALVASIGQIAVPVAGVYALSEALQLTGLLGAKGKEIARALPALGVILFSAIWLGSRIFPQSDSTASPLRLPPERRAEGRFHSFALGLMLALNALRQLIFPASEVGDAATSVLSLPLLAITGLLLVRLGALLRQHAQAPAEAGEQSVYRNRLIGFVGQGLLAVGVIGPVLGAVGYVSAAGALVFPAALSLALLGTLIILQQAVADLHSLILRDESQRQLGLLPVLFGFALSLAALPLLALIWGARSDDLTEIWQRFREGFQMGETRISPTDFLYFVLLFGFGYVLTRLVQGALKSTILPKTRIDTGGQNAIVAGTGYLGIFLAGLIAIRAVGIDLSGLAIVAGALSLGIGFGLQNIVSNFVSGIILLIERPVSEGDWIEVGTVSGTVRAISVRSTRIQTFDRSDVIVPNADLVSQRVTNWTRFNMTGRLIVPVNVVHGSDAKLVEKVLRSIAEAQPMAVLNPPPIIALAGFTMDAIQFEIRVILRDVNFSLNVRSDINHQILKRFSEEGIVLAHTPSPALALAATGPAASAAPVAGPASSTEPAPPKRPEPEEPTL
jgi:potassium-dependent mechanosensitive channel